MIAASERARFWSKVEVAGPDACWLWKAATKGLPGKEYGQLTVRRDGARFSVTAHRLSWVYHYGSTRGLCVLHRCDNRLCVNPAHLFLGTVRDNNADMAAKDRNRFGEAHWNARLSVADVQAIKAAVAIGAYQDAVAERFGINQSTVSRIARGLRRRRGV